MRALVSYCLTLNNLQNVESHHPDPFLRTRTAWRVESTKWIILNASLNFWTSSEPAGPRDEWNLTCGPFKQPGLPSATLVYKLHAYCIVCGSYICSSPVPLNSVECKLATRSYDIRLPDRLLLHLRSVKIAKFKVNAQFRPATATPTAGLGLRPRGVLLEI